MALIRSEKYLFLIIISYFLAFVKYFRWNWTSESMSSAHIESVGVSGKKGASWEGFRIHRKFAYGRFSRYVGRKRPDEIIPHFAAFVKKIFSTKFHRTFAAIRPRIIRIYFSRTFGLFRRRSIGYSLTLYLVFNTTLRRKKERIIRSLISYSIVKLTASNSWKKFTTFAISSFFISIRYS